MKINYTYQIISVDEQARCMEVVYESEGRDTRHVGARLPYDDETLESVVNTYAPIAYWLEQDRVVSLPVVGRSGALESVLVVAPNVLPPVSPRQIRMALSRAGLRSQVETAVTAGDQDLKDWWEFATAFERDNPQVLAMGVALGKTPDELDGLWELAGSL